MVKAITFDLDGVYFTAESFTRFVNKFPDPDKAMQVLKRSREMTDFKLGKMTENDYWNYAKKELGVPHSNEEIFTMLRDSYEVNAKVRDFQLKMKTKGVKTCICSNNFVTRVRELDDKFNFLKDFDIKIFSYETGIMKPDKGIFEELIRQTGVEPEEIIYSDDDKIKLTGAIDLGISAFVYKDFADFKSKCLTF